MSAWQWRRSVESGWFYAAWFSFFAAAALFVSQSRYGERQSGIERRFQARTQPLSVPQGDFASGDTARAEDYYSTPEDTVIPLWPLATLLGLLACVFGVLAVRVGWQPAARDAAAKSWVAK
jgi:hypothetical protein